jgi:multicomponent Na+:H+ antiporter subunit D
MPTSSQLIVLAVVFPLISALLLSLIPEKSDRVRNPLAVLISFITAVIVVALLLRVLAGETPYISVITVMFNMELAFRVDPLAAFFSTLASVLWVFSVIYSTGYMAHEHKRSRYFVFYLLSLGVTMGVAFSANLFTLYIFYEFLTLFTYPLVIHEENAEARAAGRRYIFYSFIGAGFILAGMVMTHGVAGTLFFIPGGIIPVSAAAAGYLNIIFICFIMGFGVKAAIMPLHAWLPSAMAAPTPVSALLHAVAVVKSGVFGILRVMYSIYGPETLSALNLGFFLMVVVSITIILASLIALRQDALKKRLAYSTISQLSYIGLGAGLLTTLGLTGSLLHMLNHALLKITLFFCAGAIITVTGKKKISELNGVGRRMPVTMMAFAVGSIGMIGILPVNGFIAKMYLIQGSLEANLPIFIVILITSAVLNAAYFLPIVIAAFFKEGDFERPQGLEAPVSMLLPIALLAVVCIIVALKLDLTLPFVTNIVDYLFYS